MYKLQVRRFLIHLACKSHTLKHNHYQNEINKKGCRKSFFFQSGSYRKFLGSSCSFVRRLNLFGFLLHRAVSVAGTHLFPNIVIQHLAPQQGVPATLKTPGSNLPHGHQLCPLGRGVGSYALQLLFCRKCTNQKKTLGISANKKIRRLATA